jgi:hypothetical protein
MANSVPSHTTCCPEAHETHDGNREDGVGGRDRLPEKEPCRGDARDRLEAEKQPPAQDKVIRAPAMSEPIPTWNSA